MEVNVMKTRSSFSVLIFFVVFAIGLAVAYFGFGFQQGSGAMWIGAISFLIALLISSAIKIADQWEKQLY
jgi:CHASE2 domain-containing sensor protein